MKKRVLLAAAALLLLLFIAILVLWRISNEESVTKSPLKSLPQIVSITATPPPRPLPPGAHRQEAVRVDLKQILYNQDICALIRVLNHSATDRFAELADLLLHNQDLLPHSREDDKNFESLFKGFLAVDEIPAGSENILKFYNALLLANLLDGASSPNPDLKQAEQLFSELEIEDPQNGAFPYFQAAVLEKLNRSAEEVQQQVRLALTASDFNTFTLQVSQHLWERGLQDPISLVIARVLMSKMPLPDYNAGYSTVLKQVLAHHELAAPAITFAERLMAEGIQFGSNRDEWVYWLAIEHNTGYHLLAKAWPLVHPDSQPGPEYTKTYKEIMQEKPSDESLYPQSELFQKISQDHAFCPLEKLQEIFNKKRQEFESFQKGHQGQ